MQVNIAQLVHSLVEDCRLLQALVTGSSVTVNIHTRRSFWVFATLSPSHLWFPRTAGVHTGVYETLSKTVHSPEWFQQLLPSSSNGGAHCRPSSSAVFSKLRRICTRLLVLLEKYRSEN